MFLYDRTAKASHYNACILGKTVLFSSNVNVDTYLA